MTARLTARVASAERYQLGEGPVWDTARQRLLWVDILGHTVHAGRLDLASGTIEPTNSWVFDGPVGAVAVSTDGDLVVAERDTLARVSPDGSRTRLARVLPAERRSRLNDAAVDPAGRFIVGSMAQDGRRGEEVLVRLEHDGRCTTLDADLSLSNGLAWSPSGDRFYSIDTVARIVRVRDYDASSGAAGPRQDLLTISDGSPDGMCTDADGNLWIAIWGRGRVECRHPNGDLLAIVEVDAPHTSSVAFAGPALDLLVITTATENMSAEDISRHPHSGHLFTARVDGVRGLPTPFWVPPSPTATHGVGA